MYIILMSKDILGKDIWGVNVDDFQLVIKRLSLNGAITEEVKARIPKYRELLGSGFSAEIKETLEANPSGREDDNPQQDRHSQATLPRENSQGERNGENNHNKKHRDSNPGRQEHDNRQQGKWKKKNPDSSSTAPRENSQGERNGENRLTENNRTPHQNADTTVNTNSITTLGENIKQQLQRNKWYIASALTILLCFSLWLPVSNTLNSWKKKNPKKVTTEQKDSIKRDWESETIDKVSATGELSHFVKEGESMYSIVTNLKSSWKLSGISSVREDIIREACEKEIIMKIKEGQTTKEKFDPRDLSPGDVIVIKIKELEDLHRQ